jgi:hemin uptake protein HemP
MQADRPDDGPARSDGAANAEPTQSTSNRTPRVINSAALMAGQSQLAILHNETLYFLRQTRLGKLILTK